MLISGIDGEEDFAGKDQEKRRRVDRGLPSSSLMQGTKIL
jgi:hypothetical protein